MKKSLVFTTVLACAGLFFTPAAFGQRYKKVELNAAVTSTGEKIRGPVSIKPLYVNRLRYRVAVKTKTTFTPGPSLALPFIPQVPSAPSSAAEGGQSADARRGAFATLMNDIRAAERARDPETEFQKIEEALANLVQRKALDIQNPISQMLADLKKARDATDSLVRESDSLLSGSNGPDAIVRRIQGVLDLIDAVNPTWPDAEINAFLADVDLLEDKITGVTDPTWLATNKPRRDRALERIKTLRESVTALSHNDKPDSPATRFDEGQKVLQQWKEIFTDVKTQRENYFQLPYIDVGCGFAFDQNKETVVTLVKQDRLAPADTAPSEQELITVVCSSPFSISGGFGFSTINEREFVFVPSTKTVTQNGQSTQQVINRFGFKNNSSFRPIPLLLLNTRVYERNDTFAMHLSAGAGVDIKTGEAGSDVEFIVGPSVSFKRSMFVTAGLHVGRVPKLAGGFQLDQEVPQGIDQPPVEKAWKPGFILTITYKLR